MNKHKITEISVGDAFYENSDVLVGLVGESELAPQDASGMLGPGDWLHGWFAPDLPPVIDGELAERVYFFGVKAEEINE